MMKKLCILFALLALSAPASAQTAQLGAGEVWANATASRAPGKSTSLSAYLDRAVGSARGMVLARQNGGWAAVTTFAAGLPLLSGSAGADVAFGTRSGNTTIYATTTGTLTSGHCVSIDAGLNFIDSGSACGGGGGGSVSGPGSTTVGFAPLWANTGGTLIGVGLPVATTGANTIVSTNGSGALVAGVMPAFTGDITNSAGSLALAYTNVVPANKGGAGTISGALKANGAGTVTQAAASDLSNGASGSGSVCLTVSCALTGTPTAPTATPASLSTTQIATLAFVQAAIAAGGSIATPGQQDFVAASGDFTPGTTTTLTLSSAPLSKGLLTIAFDTGIQSYNTFSLSGAVVTFNAAIPSNVQVVDVRWFAPALGAGVNSLGGMVGAITCGSGLTCSSNSISVTTGGLPSLANGAIWIGNASNAAVANIVSGDVTLSNAGVSALASVNSNVGAFGSTSSIPNYVVNAKGLITSSGSNAIAAPASGLTGTTLNSGIVTSSLTSVGTLTGGATGAGFTINLGTSTIAGTLGVTKGGTAQASFTANLPILGNGTSGLIQGTVSSTNGATKFATTAGTLTSTHCVSIDTNQNFVDAGAGCAAGISGSGTQGSVTAWSGTSTLTNGGGACNVRAYGAVGDGVTNDMDAIQSAINACGAIYLPRIVVAQVYDGNAFPTKCYMIGPTATNPSGTLTWGGPYYGGAVGDGPYASCISSSNGSACVIAAGTPGNPFGTYFANLLLRHNAGVSLSFPGCGITAGYNYVANFITLDKVYTYLNYNGRILGAANVAIDRDGVSVQNTNDSLYLATTTGAAAAQWQVDGLTASLNGGHGIYIKCLSGSFPVQNFTRYRSYGNGQTAVTYDVEVDGSVCDVADLSIANSFVGSGARGNIWIHTGGVTPNVIHNVGIESPGFCVSNVGVGILAQGAAPIIVTDVIEYGCGGTSTGGIQINGPLWWTIANSSFESNFNYGILVNTGAGTLSNNRTVNNNSGIVIQPGIISLSTSGNYSKGNASTNVFDSGVSSSIMAHFGDWCGNTPTACPW